MECYLHRQYSPSLFICLKCNNVNFRYNRQFRYEERDDYGVVKGRYGYYDQFGQLRIVNYSADPITGYHTDVDPVPVKSLKK